MISSLDVTKLSEVTTKQYSVTAPVTVSQSVDKRPLVSDLPPVQDIKIDSNFAATTSLLMPTTPENDIPADVSPLTLSQLPAARDVMINNVQGVGASTFAVACVEALMASQANNGAPASQTALNNYIQSIQDPQLKKALSNFVAQHKNTPASAEVDGNGNFNLALLAAAQQAYPGGKPPAKKTTPPAKPAAKPAAKPTAKPAAKKPAAPPKAKKPPQVGAKPHSQPTDGVAPSADTPPAAKPPQVGAKPHSQPTDGVAPSADTPPTPAAPTAAQQALSSIANMPANSHPAGHDYALDVASVLKEKDGNASLNTNPSAAQFASFMYTLFLTTTPATKQANPNLANYLKTTLDHVYPTHPAPGSIGPKTLSASMLQQIQVAENVAGYNPASNVPPTAKQQQAIYGALQNNLVFTFAYAGLSANGIPNINMNPGNGAEVAANGKNGLNLPINDPNVPTSTGPVSGGK